MKKIIILFCLLLFLNKTFAQESLFAIKIKEKTGYINVLGKLVIPANFDSGIEFKDGFAVVEYKNKFGIINTKGTYAAQPIYDMIGEFKNGAGIAVKNGRRILIAPDGKILYEGDFIRCSGNFNGNLIIVKSIDDLGNPMVGVYNVLQKRFIVPPVYKNISDFSGDYAIGFISNDDTNDISQHSDLISMQGKISPLKNIYRDVEDFGGVLLANTRYDDPVIISNTGKIISVLKDCRLIENEVYHDGLLMVSYYNKDSSYRAFVTNEGKMLHKWEDTFECGITNFTDGRAWMYDSLGYMLINKKLEKVLKGKHFTNVSEFNHGKAMVASDAGWNIIDANGKYLLRTTYEFVDNKLGIYENSFLFKEKEQDSLCGLASVSGKVLLKPSISKFSSSGFKDGLLYCIIRDNVCYVNTQGEIVWSEPFNNKELCNSLREKYASFNSSFYRFYGTELQDGESNTSKINRPKIITEDLKFEKDKLNFRVDYSKNLPFEENTIGYKLYLANTTNEDELFLGPGRNIFMQAKDWKGNWRAIEEIPHPIDGMSEIKLHPNEYWEFVIPHYTGTFKTELRMVVRSLTGDSISEFKLRYIYSNSFPGSVNPTQFFDSEGNEPYDWMTKFNKAD